MGVTAMIFHEIYGCYYNAVAKLLDLAVEGRLTEREMYAVVNELGYEESVLNVIPALKEQRWQLVDETFATPIKKAPTLPLTELEKRWVKTILLDPRIALFQIPTGEFKNVEPLFEPGDIVYFDRYTDGDDYKSPEYIANFYILLQALREKKKVEIEFRNKYSVKKKGKYSPVSIEYSDKEDKFRLLTVEGDRLSTINIGRIVKCRRLDEPAEDNLKLPERYRKTAVFELCDERNALERTMLRFAHFEKRVERLEEKRYRVELHYDRDDETDLVIQLLSFGKYIKVLEPESLKKEICERVKRQMVLFKK